MLSVQSIPPSVGRAQRKSWSPDCAGTNSEVTSPDQAIARTASPLVIDSTYELPATWRT